MGPASLDWYRKRGLTKTIEHVADRDTMFYNSGERYTTEEITESYSCGRIDVRGVPNEPFGLEIGVPPMLTTDWREFGAWLDSLTTISVWSLNDLVESYYFWTKNPTITWSKND